MGCRLELLWSSRLQQCQVKHEQNWSRTAVILLQLSWTTKGTPSRKVTHCVSLPGLLGHLPTLPWGAMAGLRLQGLAASGLYWRRRAGQAQPTGPQGTRGGLMGTAGAAAGGGGCSLCWGRDCLCSAGQDGAWLYFQADYEGEDFPDGEAFGF